jgi:hypothetical protein
MGREGERQDAKVGRERNEPVLLSSSLGVLAHCMGSRRGTPRADIGRPGRDARAPPLLQCVGHRTDIPRLAAAPARSATIPHRCATTQRRHWMTQRRCATTQRRPWMTQCRRAATQRRHWMTQCRCATTERRRWMTHVDVRRPNIDVQRLKSRTRRPEMPLLRPQTAFGVSRTPSPRRPAFIGHWLVTGRLVSCPLSRYAGRGLG